MAHFLRDQHVSNLSVSVENLTQIDAVFAERARAMNASLPEDSEYRLIRSYIIRFDNKGYRVFSLQELLQYFHQAREVERVIFSLDSGVALRTTRQLGAYLELVLDTKNSNSCLLTATADDKDWVDASFAAVYEIAMKCKNLNGWVRTQWTGLVVQIIGVTLGFVLSLWAAAKIAPTLSVENAFLIAFLFLLLIFSNTWGFISQKIVWLIDKLFPNIAFYRPGKDKLHWLMQAIVGGVVGAFVLFLLGLAFSFFVDVLGALVNKGR